MHPRDPLPGNLIGDAHAALTRRYLEEGFWSRSETLQTRVRDVARAAPERLAAVDAAGRRLEYGALDAQADALASSLEELGVGPGVTVGMQLPNRVEALVVMSAVERAQGIVCPLMPMYRAKELEYIAKAADMRVLFVPGTYRRFDYEALAQQLMAGGLIEHGVTIEGAGRSGQMHRLADLVGRDADRARRPALDPDMDAGLMFTSGTTGTPKGVLHSHNTMLAGHRTLAPLLGLGEDDPIFVPSVVGHATGYLWGIRFALYLGTSSVLLDVWEPDRAARLITEQRCSWTMVAPTFVQDLLDASERADIDLRTMRYLSCGGAAPATYLHAATRERLGCSLLRLYGQTEAFLSTHCLPGDPEEKLTNTEGRALPGVELRVMRADGSPAPAGAMGSLHARGPHRCVGLLTEDGLRRLDRDEWMPSGDLAALDADGFLSIKGREKEFINRGGLKYSPVEVEDLLHRHPAIARVAVVAVPDRRLGERGCACVVTKPGALVDVPELVEYLTGAGVAAFKWPERVELFEELPTTPSGKVQKHVLQRLLAERVD